MMLNIYIDSRTKENPVVGEILKNLIESAEEVKLFRPRITHDFFPESSNDIYIYINSGESLPDLPFQRTFVIYIYSAHFRRDLPTLSFAGVSTYPLLCYGTPIIIGREDVFQNLNIKLDLYRGPVLKSNMYTKATALEDITYSRFVIQYLDTYWKNLENLNSN